jgi:2-polyprenyl-3-methyl-5-hydroxy-6-metoxy-1,4-benzoquinol methylase
MVKEVPEWTRHWNGKASIKNEVELNGYCVNGEPITDEKFCRIVIEQSVALLEVEPGHVVLDIGCGSGQILCELEKRGARCVGADASKSMIDRFSGQSQTILKAAHELKFEPGSFDRILLLSVVHYFPSTTYFSRIIEKCVTWLRAPGIILIGDIPLTAAVSGKSDYLIYDKHELLDILDRFGHPFSLMAQVREKRLVNRRADAVIYKDHN